VTVTVGMLYSVVNSDQSVSSICRSGTSTSKMCLYVQRHRTSSPRKITSWSRFLHYKLTVPQLVKKLLPFYGNWQFTAIFWGSCHLSLSWARWNQFTPSHPVSLRSILIYRVYTLVFQEVSFFMSSSPIKDFCDFLIYCERCMPCLVSYPDTLILHFVVHASVTIQERWERATLNYILESSASIYQHNSVLVATGQWGSLPVKVCVFLRTS